MPIMANITGRNSLIEVSPMPAEGQAGPDVAIQERREFVRWFRCKRIRDLPRSANKVSAAIYGFLG